MASFFKLHNASRNGHIKEVKRLLETEGGDVNQSDFTGLTPLYWASCYGHLNVVSYLLDRGALINISSSVGTTPLISACQVGNRDIVALLLERGANPFLQDIYGDTALTIARKRNYPNCVVLLEKYQHFHRFRKEWLSFATSLSSYQEGQQQEVQQNQIRSPSLMKMMDSSDLVRYLTEYM